MSDHFLLMSDKRFYELVFEFTKKQELVQEAQEELEEMNDYLNDLGEVLSIFLSDIQNKYKEAQEAFGKDNFKEKFEELGKTINAFK